MVTANPKSTDVFVAGGGPAGLAAAIAARLRGFDVTIADTFVPPIDKACGEGLMPDGVAALRALGIAPERNDHAIFRGIRFVGAHGHADALFPEGHGIGLRRIELHDALRRRAEELGVNMQWGVRVNGIAQNAVFTSGGSIETRWIVGADGRTSRVRDWAGMSRGARDSFRIGLRRHFRVARWTDLVEVHWGDTGQAYVTPVAEDEICVAVISRDRHADFDGIVRQCPSLARHLTNAEGLDEVRGSATATCNLRSVIANGVALIGEASGSVDAITGEGMTLAFRQAAKLADAIVVNNLRSYAKAHKKIGRLPNLLGAAMLLMDRNAAFRRRALKALCDNPSIFQRLLAIHLGQISPLDFGVLNAASLGWQLLRVE